MKTEIAINMTNRLCMVREVTGADQICKAIADIESITEKLTEEQKDEVFAEVIRRRGLIKAI